MVEMKEGENDEKYNNNRFVFTQICVEHRAQITEHRAFVLLVILFVVEFVAVKIIVKSNWRCTLLLIIEIYSLESDG